MDSSFYYIFIVIALLFAIWAVFVYLGYQKLNKILKRTHEMTETTTGVITSIPTVCRRNQTFRWRNEYPIITFHAEGIDVCIEATYAERAKGTYDLGQSYHISYVPGEPACCVIDEFRTKMQKSCKYRLVGFVILVIITFNIFSTTILEMLG